MSRLRLNIGWVLTLVACLLAAAITGWSLSASGAETTPRFHVVTQGQTWDAIAAGYNVDVNALKLANNHATSYTTSPRAGRYLFVPVETLPPTTTTAAPTTTVTPTTTIAPTTTTTVAPTTTTVAPTTTTTTTTVTPPPSGTFTATFDTPADFTERFDIYAGNYTQDDCFTTACRGESNGVNPTAWNGDHSATDPCGGATTSRTVTPTPHSNMFYWCGPMGPASGHVMTSINTSQYAIIAFSPKQSFTDVTRVCVDVNRTDLGGGKWINLTIVPEAKFLSHPNLNPARASDGEGPYRLDYVAPLFSEPNAPGSFNLQDLDGVVSAKFFRGLAELNVGFNIVDADNNFNNGVSDKMARYRHCLVENPNGTIEAWRIEPNGSTQVVRAAGQFPSGAARVIFEDDTYDADKHDGTGTYTWHWDNVEIVSG